MTIVRLARLCVPVIVDRLFDYEIPEDMNLDLGALVQVNFAGRMMWGAVWELATIPRSEAHPKLKPIIAHYAHLLPLTASLRHFLTLCAQYNCTPLGMMLKSSCPHMDAQQTEPTERWICLVHRDIPASAARTKLFDLLHEGSKPYSEVREAGISSAVLRSVEALGAIRYEDRVRTTLPPPPLCVHAPTLTHAQREAADRLIAAQHEGYQCFMLDGATGSGKTEVFFEATEAVIRAGKQAVLLLPEIALSLGIQQRAVQRFGIEPVLWHSSQTPSHRIRDLRRILSGEAQLIIGARSALFLPYPHLGLIVIDEEHESSYKQEDGAHYHGRDMGLLRARIEGIPIVLASATPSLETWHHCQEQRYHSIILERRAEQALLPVIHRVDMRKESLPKQRWISTPLHNAIQRGLAANTQSLLFLNRRGYAPLTLCRSCGHRYECPSCSAWLVYHAQHQHLLCHHCGLTTPLPPTCPSCGASHDQLSMVGVGIERIAEEARTLFPEARLCVLSGDSHDKTHEMQHALDSMQRNEVDIIIGTQLLAKGHHFPHLACVGVIDGDSTAMGSDVRAMEKTYQLLHQLAGRAGREQVRGEVYIQTYQPETPMMDALCSWDRDRFMRLECEERRKASMPPYSRLASLIIEGRPEEEVQRIVKEAQKNLPHVEGVHVFGPAPAPLYKLRNNYRYRFLLVGGKRTALQPIIKAWCATINPPKTVQLRIDIDPISFV
ncbi:MAG: primosomal protein N' [Alphaproteobacteria bacterium]|nr:MAG: primosomal protein N' [Alphaproteobacteria bacterium]